MGDGETGYGGGGSGGRVGGAAVEPDTEEVGERAEDGDGGEGVEFGFFKEGGGGGVGRGFIERSVVWGVWAFHVWPLFLRERYSRVCV